MTRQHSILSGRRILIVEDTPENMRLFHAILRLEDAVVLEANHATLGIELARTEIPDIILMDIQMPEVDGLSATRVLRADPLTKDIPILILTALSMPEDKKRAFDAGCDGYITKPIEPQSFVAQIASFLPARD